jgi:hypothetical protein
MAHVTMIHGIGRKPAQNALLGIWRRAPATGAGAIDLGASGITTSMVYWADVLYPEPDPDVSAHESADEQEALASDIQDIGQPVTFEKAAESEWIARLGGKLLLQETMAEGMGPVSPERHLEPEERILLPWH